MPKRPKTERPTPPDGLTFPREVTITGKAHPHHGRTGMASGESARPPGSDEDLLRIDFPDGSSCYASLFDTSLTQDLKDLLKPRRRSVQEAKAAAKKKTKARVTNGGAAGNARNLLQNAGDQEPLAEPPKARKKREPEQTCGAEGKRGAGPCRHPAGFRTDHKGSGRCYLHGGRTPAPTGRYTSVDRPRLRALIEKFEKDPDPMNLLPEVQLLRALLHDYIDRYAEQDEMLTRWNLSFEKGFQADWTDWWREMRADALEREDDLSEELIGEMPDPMDYLPSKPLRMADITEVKGLIGQVGQMVERVRKLQTQHTFTMETITLLWRVMGGHMTDAAMEVITDDDVRSAFLTSVERRYSTISLAELASRRPAD